MNISFGQLLILVFLGFLFFGDLPKMIQKITKILRKSTKKISGVKKNTKF
jgi:Sec-independent protein translocase protein TatA